MKILLVLFISICYSISFAQTNIETAKNEALKARRAFEEGKYAQALEGFKKVDDLLAPSITSYYFQTICNYILYDFIAAKETMDNFFILEPSGYMYDEIKKLSGAINRESEKVIKEKNDYEYANSTNNTTAKINFINAYPNSNYKKTITDQLDVLLWAKARETHNVSDYEKYVKNLPFGRNINKAKEFLDFKKAMKANSIQNFENFKSKYPRADSIRIVDQKLQDSYLHQAELNLKDKKYDAAISFCNKYTSAYPIGSDVAEIKDILQASYYYIGEGHRINNRESSAKASYNKAMNVKKSGTYYTKSYNRLDEYRMNALRVRKHLHYEIAMGHRKKANKELFFGMSYFTIGVASLGTSYYLVEEFAEDDPSMYILVATGAFVSIVAFWGSINDFKLSKKHRSNYRIEMQKYNSIRVAYAPYYNYQHKTLGLSLNINF